MYLIIMQNKRKESGKPDNEKFKKDKEYDKSS